MKTERYHLMYCTLPKYGIKLYCIGVIKRCLSSLYQVSRLWGHLILWNYNKMFVQPDFDEFLSEEKDELTSLTDFLLMPEQTK